MYYTFKIHCLKKYYFFQKKMFPPIFETLTIFKQTEGNEDDFKDLFNGTTIKIYAIVIALIRLTFTNIFYILVLLFEKYGGDPMKRSLKNQLVSQFGYGMMISNTICNPLLTWRIMFGPMPEGYIFIRYSNFRLHFKKYQ